MKAIVWTRYGPPEVLKLEEVEKPSPKDDEVLVKVHATSAYAGDCEMRSFNIAPSIWPWLRLYIGLTKPKRLTILGQEMAGVIEGIGKDVKRFKVGDEVFGTSGMKFGTYAEYICVRENAQIVKKPITMTFEEAAVTSVGGSEAIHFYKKANIQNGQKVLINGAGGSIGTMALQLAKISGAYAVCVDSLRKFDMLEGLGADEVIDYSKEDFRKNLETYDIVLDLVGKTPFSRTIRSLKKDGVLILGNSGYIIPKMLGLWVAMTSKRKVLSNMAAGTVEDLEDLKKFIAEGKIKIVIDERFPLERTADAHRYIENGMKKGNVVITVAD